MVRSELALVDWGLLNPLTHLQHDRPWTLVWVQLLAFAFCVPLGVACYYRETATLEEAAWALSLYFAVLWAVFLHRCIQPDRIPKRTLLAVWSSTAILGVLAVILLTALGELIPGFREIFAASASANWVWRFMGMTLTVGLIEEGVKALPVLWIAYRKKTDLRPATIIYLGAVSGLAFGATEGMLYSIAYATDHRSNYLTDGAYLVVQVVRFVSLPLLHAVWSGTFGYYIALAAARQPGAQAILSIGLIGVAVLHGVYNSMADHWGGFAMATASLAVFVSYVRRSLSLPPERTPSELVTEHPESQ